MVRLEHVTARDGDGRARFWYRASTETGAQAPDSVWRMCT
jgi:hypothetical protein